MKETYVEPAEESEEETPDEIITECDETIEGKRRC